MIEARTLRRLARFGALGGVGFVLNLTITITLHAGFGVAEEIAFAVALVTVFFFSFFSSRYIIFPEATQGDPVRQLTQLAVLSAVFRSAEFLGFLVLNTWLGVPYILAAVGVLAASFLAKFVTYNRVVFTRDRGKA